VTYGSRAFPCRFHMLLPQFGTPAPDRELWKDALRQSVLGGMNGPGPTTEGRKDELSSSYTPHHDRPCYDDTRNCTTVHSFDRSPTTSPSPPSTLLQHTNAWHSALGTNSDSTLRLFSPLIPGRLTSRRERAPTKSWRERCHHTPRWTGTWAAGL